MLDQVAVVGQAEIALAGEWRSLGPALGGPEYDVEDAVLDAEAVGQEMPGGRRYGFGGHDGDRRRSSRPKLTRGGKHPGDRDGIDRQASLEGRDVRPENRPPRDQVEEAGNLSLPSFRVYPDTREDNLADERLGGQPEELEGRERGAGSFKVLGRQQFAGIRAPEVCCDGTRRRKLAEP